MDTFEDFNVKKQLRNAIADLGFEKPTPIQQASYSPILGGSDFVGIAQTGNWENHRVFATYPTGIEVFGSAKPKGTRPSAYQRAGHSDR